MAQAYFQLRNWSGAAESYANVLTIYPNNQKSYRFASDLYHNKLFKFEEAFALTQQWVIRNPDDLSAQSDSVEKHFTTGRFAECGQIIDGLLTKREIPVDTKFVVRAIAIANSLALNRPAQVPAKLADLIAEVSAQPVEFRVEWSFEGTKQFIGQNETLSSCRAWLGKLFDALACKDRETMLDALRQVKASFKED